MRIFSSRLILCEKRASAPGSSCMRQDSLRGFEYNFDTMRIVISLLLLVAAAALSAMAADIPLVGVWKLNPPKSHFSHGDLPLRLVLTITSDGAGGIQYASRNHLTDGSSGGASFDAKFDGKNYPVTGAHRVQHGFRSPDQCQHLQREDEEGRPGDRGHDVHSCTGWKIPDAERNGQSRASESVQRVVRPPVIGRGQSEMVRRRRADGKGSGIR